jgi:hypothetical protein
MTLYDAPGELLNQIALAVTSAPEGSDDPAWERDLHQIEIVSRRMAAMWRDLFACLWKENDILEATLEEILARFEFPPPVVTSGSRRDDPLELHSALLGDLNRIFAVLEDDSPSAWAQDARRILRRGLGAAAEVQGRIVDAAFDA